MDVEFVRDVHSAKEQGEFRTALRMIAKIPHVLYTYTDMLANWANFQTALSIASNGLDDEEAFPKQAERMPPFEWARTFMYHWPALEWVAMRVTSLTCSASGCEHSWSIEGPRPRPHPHPHPHPHPRLDTLKEEKSTWATKCRNASARAYKFIA